MIKDVSNFVEEIVNNIDNTLQGTYNAVTEVTDMCKTKYARVGKYVKDSTETEYLITDLKRDEWLKVETATGELTLPKPYFLSGTRISANREWTIATSDLTQKTPIIWLLSDVRYFQYGRQSVYDWASDIRLFFLDETDATNYYSEDHVQNVVTPMSELAKLFMEVVEKDRKYLTIDSFEMRNFTRFGTESQEGYVENILDANLSGVELIVTLTKYKENCKC